MTIVAKQSETPVRKTYETPVLTKYPDFAEITTRAAGGGDGAKKS
jgi:hypothetical protein